MSGVQPIAGFDETGAEPLYYVGLIHTVSGGISESTSIGTALLNLQFSQFYAGREFRIYGIEETTSITSGLGTYASLASEQPLTDAYASFTVDSAGEASVDLTSVVQELVNLSGWSTSSPFQFWIGDSTGTPATGIDALLEIDFASYLTVE